MRLLDVVQGVDGMMNLVGLRGGQLRLSGQPCGAGRTKLSVRLRLGLKRWRSGSEPERTTARQSQCTG